MNTFLVHIPLKNLRDWIVAEGKHGDVDKDFQLKGEKLACVSPQFVEVSSRLQP